MDDLTASQLEDWLAWLRKFYVFPHRQDYYFAALLALTHNVNCAESSDTVRPEDFLIYQDPDDRFSDELSVDDILHRLGIARNKGSAEPSAS